MGTVNKRELYLWVGIAVIVLALWVVFIVLDLPLWVPLALTLPPAVVFGVVFTVRYLRAVRGAAALEHALGQQARGAVTMGRPDLEAEIKELSDEFNKAVASLKASQLRGGGRNALYALPWYALIGPPGSGKSTALRNSGLHFPYLSTQRGGALKGVGGTRNCDWWLTNEGVLLDTAGRWSTQDDEEEWVAFLKLLKQHRRRQPLNGLMVAISMGDVVQTDDEGRSHLARRLRQRLDELVVRLGISAPVYVIFTKCDLIPGFVESFGDLPKAERGQVWGFTAPISKPIPSHGAYFTEHFNTLVGSLEDHALLKMGQTRKVDERALVFSFTRQFASTRDGIAEFLEELFQPNVYNSSPTLRGVYFTSATQEGRPVDRLLKDLATEFGIEAQVPVNDVPVPKSYFLNDVFSEVIFKDKVLAAPTEANARQKRLLRFATAACLFVAALLVAVLPISAWGASQRFIQSTMALVEQVSPKSKSAKRVGKGELVIRLDAIREAISRLETYRKEGPPPTMGFGMYRGEAFYHPLRKRYIELLRQRIVRPVVEAAELDLRRWSELYSTKPDATPPLREYFGVYDALKTYLYLTEPKEANEPSFAGEGRDGQKAWLARQIAERWAAREGGDLRESTLRTLQSQVELYLAFLAEQSDLASPRSRDAVYATRRALGRVSAAKLALEQLVMDYEKRGFDMDLRTMVGSTGSWLTAQAKVRGAFTRNAWDDGIRERLEAKDVGLGEGWVVAGPAKGDAFIGRARAKLREVYFNAYVEEWQRFVDSLELKEVGDKSQALALLQELTRGNPPLFGRLLTQIHRNTHLPLPEPEKPVQTGLAAGGLAALREKAASAADQAAARAQQALGQNGAADAGTAEGAPPKHEPKDAAEVARAYEDLTRFAVPATDPADSSDAGGQAQQTDLAVYQEQLALLRDALQMYQENPDNASALMTRLQEARVRVLALLDAQPATVRPRLESLLWPPIEASSVSLGHSVASGTGRTWCDQVFSAYERTVKGRYPFSHRGEDVSVQDFSAFYQPQSGALWAFYEQTLSKEVRSDGNGFSFSTQLGQSADAMYKRNLLAFLKESRAVSRAFFPQGSDGARVELDVLIHPTPGVTGITLRAHGQTIRYRNGPEQWTRIQWPGPKPSEGASLEVAGADGRVVRFKEAGEWGIFRLLERAHTVPSSAGSRTLAIGWQLEQDGTEVSVEVRSARADSPMNARSGGRRGAILDWLRSSQLKAPKSIVEGGGGCGG